MTGADVVTWLQDYWHDLLHWQHVEVWWLLVRTLILLLVANFIWTLFYRIIGRRWSTFWHHHLKRWLRWVNPFRIPMYFIRRRRIRIQQEERVLYEEQLEQERREKERLEQEQKSEALALVRDTFAIHSVEGKTD